MQHVAAAKENMDSEIMCRLAVCSAEEADSFS